MYSHLKHTYSVQLFNSYLLTLPLLYRNDIFLIFKYQIDMSNSEIKSDSKYYPLARVIARSVLVVLLTCVLISISPPSDSVKIMFISLLMCVIAPVVVGYMKRTEGELSFRDYQNSLFVLTTLRLVLFGVYQMSL